MQRKANVHSLFETACRFAGAAPPLGKVDDCGRMIRGNRRTCLEEHHNVEAY
jgi:hypothetical protein